MYKNAKVLFYMEFTLPPLTQQSFSRWYNKKVPRVDNVEEHILYPGIALTCSTKSRDLRSQITAKNIFITYEKESGLFHHKVLGSNNAFASLPKRLYSQCFHNINIHSLPPANRMTVRLTENTSVVLPYIPDDFVAQKRAKRGGMALSRKTRGSAKKSKVDSDAQREATVCPDVLYTGWVSNVMAASTETAAQNGIDSFRLMLFIRKQLAAYDEDFHSRVSNPFNNVSTMADIQSDGEKKMALEIVIGFMHHYGKHLLFA